MELISSPSLPLTSDPALCEDWEELNPLILPSSTNSDDLEALNQVREETIARKNKQGDVIQHRARTPEQSFQSEADYLGGRSCSAQSTT